MRRSKDCGTKYDISGSVAVPARSRETVISITGEMLVDTYLGNLQGRG